MSRFLSDEEIAEYEDSQSKVQEDIKKLSPEVQKAVAEANEAFEEMTDLVFDFASENRVRSAGYLPSQAENLAKLMRDEKIKVGQIFEFLGKQKVLTPFETVVDAQVYLTALQDRVLETTTVPVEIEVAGLKKTIQEFTSLSFVGLIGLAIKRLFKRG